jgi:hypothetical protein
VNIQAIAILTTSIVVSSTALSAGDIGPAWQQADFVMEEVVVTAKATTAGAELAWQTPGYLMEEVVVAAAAPSRTQPMAWQEPDFVMEEVRVTARRTDAEEASRERFALRLKHLAFYWNLQVSRPIGGASGAIDVRQ